jgi:hypothetical protein
MEMTLLANLLHRFGFALPFWECDQERYEAFNLKSPTNAVEGLVEHGVESFLNGLSLRKFKTIEVLENGDRVHFIAGVKELRLGSLDILEYHFRYPHSTYTFCSSCADVAVWSSY